MKDLASKVAVITGGASGIGRAMADAFAAEGMKLVLADVDADALRRAEAELAAAGVSVAARRTDVSRAEDVEALARFALESCGAVHVVCNNAGVGVGGVSWQNTVKDWEWVLGVNLWGVIHGIRSFVPRMIQQGDDCHIVNTASGAGLHTRPFLGMYAASKHAVVALSECLYHELALMGTRVKVSVLCPAVVNTRIGESERTRPPGLRNDADEGAPAAQMQAMEQAFRAMLASGLPPAEVAARTLQAIREERFYITTSDDTIARVQARMEDIVHGQAPRLLPVA